jgi:hypothetical protein
MMTMTNRMRAAGLAIALAMVACGKPVELRIVQATYGKNCQAPTGNATVSLARACDGKTQCTYRVDVQVLGDPAGGCAKNFEAIWRCPGEENVRRVELPGEAGFGSIANLSCRAS